MKLRTCFHAMYTLSALSPSGQPVSYRPFVAHTWRADSAASVAIRDELRAYYRDLHDRNWTSIVTHFYPAKVTARFAVPDDDPAWIALAVPPIDSHESPDAHGYCVPSMALAIVGHWARARARRCTGEVDEAWFYAMSGRWKIIHLVSGTPLATSETGRNRHRTTSRTGRLHVSFARCLESSRSTIATTFSRSTGERR